MSYVKTNWKDHVLSNNNYTLKNNTDGTYSINPAGEIVQQGTPMSADNFNHLEQGVYDADKNAADALSKIGSGNAAGSTTPGGAAASAEKLETARTINGLAFDGTSSIVNYGVCSTGGGVAAKIISCPGFSLTVGSTIKIRFTSTNTADSISLNVNSTGDKPVWYHGAAMTSKSLKILANDIYEFTYDGVNYRYAGDQHNVGQTTTESVNSNYGILFADSPDNIAGVGVTRKSTKFFVNPYTGTLTAKYFKSSSGGNLLYSGAISIAGGSVTIQDLADYSVVLLQTYGVGANGLSCGITTLIPIAYISKGDSIRLYGGIPSSSYITSDGPQAAKDMGGYITASMTSDSPSILTLEQSVGIIGNIQIYSII